MTANQVQIRRDSAGNLDAAVPANGELAYDTTNKALRLGDGSTTGGIKVPNAPILQGQTYLSADASGTNTITVTVTPAPAAYVKYQRFVFKAAATNTGAATININSLGAKTIKKRTSTGVADVEAADIQQDGVYAVVYDGTYMQLEDAPSSAAAGGGDFELISTATASSSATIDIELPTGYSDFEVICKKIVPSSTGSVLILRTSTDGGSSFAASGYYWLNQVQSGGAAQSLLTQTALTSGFGIALQAAGDGVTSANGANVTVRTGGSNISSIFNVEYVYSFTNGSNLSVSGKGVGVRTSASDVDYIRFIFSAGNITSGTFYLYGKKDT